MKKTTILVLLSTSLFACRNGNINPDATGTFEAVETIISSEVAGTVKELSIEEGKTLKTGEIVGYIDSIQLVLKRKQIESQIIAVLSKTPDKKAQIAALEEQLKQAKHELARIEKLQAGGAATQKQLDDASSQVAIISNQLRATQSSLNITSTSIGEESIPLKMQIEQLNDQLSKCRLVNPVEGTVLSQYVRKNEMVTVGKPLYKIADLSKLILKVYITGDQLVLLKIGQNVKVLTDDGKGGYKSYPGTIDWISDRSEFTPKTIQTKDERANLVYAVKINVQNDGYLKIGMYGEVLFNESKLN
ncbi:MAG TPA: HlyD family efflux transporter periplasmic adaptor subunit [Lentimicrobium sp.]|nr:HlyD family efflux transporter periplasmic adaptor subunit [Lentimicrobium sp.]